jgi:membrane-bound ClpP family serine protease
MDLIAIGALILVGILLLLLEFLVIPGTTIAGVIGGLLIIIGVVLSYIWFDTKTGNTTLILTLCAVGISIYFVLKSDTWNIMSLNTTIDSKAYVNEGINVFEPGDEGKTVSRLAPMGTIMIKDQIIEVKTDGLFIDPNVDVIIERIENNSIYVKPKNTSV